MATKEERRNLLQTGPAVKMVDDELAVSHSGEIPSGMQYTTTSSANSGGRKRRRKTNKKARKSRTHRRKTNKYY